MDRSKIPAFPKIKGAYIVGGSVRDLILERNPQDYDIAVLKNPEEFAQRLARQFNGRVVKIGKPGIQIHRVCGADQVIDVAEAQGGSIETDLSCRDFTINAMAYALKSGQLIDPLGGLEDLKKKWVRMVAKENLEKDPVRLIRAFRISAALDFDIESKTVSAIRSRAPRIRTSAAERVRRELMELLAARNACLHLKNMAETGLLSAIIPEMECLKGCSQNIHHAFDVYDHTLTAVTCLEQLLNEIRGRFTNRLDRVEAYVQGRQEPLLKWAMLLHDVGKPKVRTTDHAGNIHFYGHARKSAEIEANIAVRLRFSKQDRGITNLLIRRHMRPLFLFHAFMNGRIRRSAYVRFFTACGNHTQGVLLNAIADAMGKRSVPGNGHEAFIRFAWNTMDAFFKDFYPQKSKPPLITGNDLIGIFGLEPSSIFKKILRVVEEARLSKTISCRSEALKMVADLLDRPGGISDLR